MQKQVKRRPSLTLELHACGHCQSSNVTIFKVNQDDYQTALCKKCGALYHELVGWLSPESSD